MFADTEACIAHECTARDWIPSSSVSVHMLVELLDAVELSNLLLVILAGCVVFLAILVIRLQKQYGELLAQTQTGSPVPSPPRVVTRAVSLERCNETIEEVKDSTVSTGSGNDVGERAAMYAPSETVVDASMPRRDKPVAGVNSPSAILEQVKEVESNKVTVPDDFYVQLLKKEVISPPMEDYHQHRPPTASEPLNPGLTKVNTLEYASSPMDDPTPLSVEKLLASLPPLDGSWQAVLATPDHAHLRERTPPHSMEDLPPHMRGHALRKGGQSLSSPVTPPLQPSRHSDSHAHSHSHSDSPPLLSPPAHESEENREEEGSFSALSTTLTLTAFENRLSAKKEERHQKQQELLELREAFQASALSQARRGYHALLQKESAVKEEKRERVRSSYGYASPTASSRANALSVSPTGHRAGSPQRESLYSKKRRANHPLHTPKQSIHQSRSTKTPTSSYSERYRRQAG
jgi:hypothetical protein